MTEIELQVIEVEDADARLVEAWRLLATMILDGIEPLPIIAQPETEVNNQQEGNVQTLTFRGVSRNGAPDSEGAEGSQGADGARDYHVAL